MAFYRLHLPIKIGASKCMFSAPLLRTMMYLRHGNSKGSLQGAPVVRDSITTSFSKVIAFGCVLNLVGPCMSPPSNWDPVSPHASVSPLFGRCLFKEEGCICLTDGGPAVQITESG